MEQIDRSEHNPGPSLLYLFISFLRLGAHAARPWWLTSSGKMAVEKKHWISVSHPPVTDSLRQNHSRGRRPCSLPLTPVSGPGELPGLRSVSFGFGLPAFLLMMILSALYAEAHTLPAVVSAFNGLQVIVVALVANATFTFGRTSIKNWKNVINAVIAGGLFWLKVSPILVILISAFLGMILYKKQPPPGQTSRRKRRMRRNPFGGSLWVPS